MHAGTFCVSPRKLDISGVRLGYAWGFGAVEAGCGVAGGAAGDGLRVPGDV